jgi:hypothetical protein
MSKRSNKPAKRQTRATTGGQRLVVVGVRRKEPDWDGYIAALLSYALRKVDEENGEAENGDES